jgi:hypothetical protein
LTRQLQKIETCKEELQGIVSKDELTYPSDLHKLAILGSAKLRLRKSGYETGDGMMTPERIPSEEQ